MENENDSKKRAALNHERGLANVEQGNWGEDVAAEYLESMGWRIIGRQVHPVKKDKRCEIDIIVRSRSRPLIAFVEVKTHKSYSERATRLRAITRAKIKTLLRGFDAWLRCNRWSGNYRFDVIQIYGWKDSPLPPDIDHIENVNIFPFSWRFKHYG